MNVSEDDLLPISALQHLLFCPRQCALIHIERLWSDNRYTALGNLLHEKAHTGKPETRDGVRITRGLPLHSFELGLSGQADVIEWEPPADQHSQRRSLAALLRTATPEQRRRWRVTPVEYKRGQPKKNDCDRVQLCAQAICLEEMLDIHVPAGALFYGQNRRRHPVEFDAPLRDLTKATAAALHQMFAEKRTPPAIKEKKCDTCSLLHLCLPAAMSQQQSAKEYLRQIVK